jgi:hypothetical protein
MNPKDANSLLHRLGLGVNRGLFMETPKGIVRGKMQFDWGRKLSYRGGVVGRSPLIIALEAYEVRNPEGFRYHHNRRNSLGEHVHKCPGCGNPFASTRSDALCCSSKCRKRLSRGLAK